MPELIGLEKLRPEDLGPFLKYINDPKITDIDYNGQALWTKDIYNVREIQKEDIPEGFIQNFCQKIANITSRPFNKVDHVLEAETKNLRITCVHDSVAISGLSVCLRKTTDVPRINYENAILEGYASEQILQLLIRCIRAKMNVVICGEPGVGKTELAKFLCQYIPNEERVITIEDNPEWHYREFKPLADCVELRVNEEFDYTKALKTCLRMDANRIMLSEVRSVEAMHLIECWTGGMKGITTMHTDDVRKIPDRILNMMPTRLDAERLENNVYESLDLGILLRTKAEDSNDGQRYRYIDQVSFFERKNGNNTITEVVRNGTFLHKEIPEGKLEKLQKADNTEQSCHLEGPHRKGEQIDKDNEGT